MEVKPSKRLHSLLTENLRDFLVKAKLKQPSQSNKTQPNIISHCNDGRSRTCRFIARGTSSYTFYNTGEQRKIPRLSCSSDNLIYLINCKRCIKKDPTLPCQYIGQTSRTLRERFGEHRRGIQNNTDESVPIHFNQPKHTLNDVQLIPILHINNNRDSIPTALDKKSRNTSKRYKSDLRPLASYIRPITRASLYEF